MLRVLVTTLAVAFALVPPGVCACRLEAMILDPSPVNDSDCPEDDGDHHDCDCVRVQQDCVISTGPIVQGDQDGAACWISVAPVGSMSRSQFVSAPAPFRWPDLPPLYLVLRALLL